MREVFLLSFSFPFSDVHFRKMKCISVADRLDLDASVPINRVE